MNNFYLLLFNINRVPFSCDGSLNKFNSMRKMRQNVEMGKHARGSEANK